MTGFGKSVVQSHESQLVVEIRSLNSRSLDFTARLPQSLRAFEPVVRKIVNEKVKRGKVECTIAITDLAEGGQKLLNHNLLRKIKSELLDISPELDDAKRTELAIQLYHQNGIEELPSDGIEINEFTKAVEAAVEELMQFRRQEGKALEDELALRVKNISQFIPQIEVYEKERLQNTKDKLNKALEELNGSADTSRLEQELVYYAERLDITEEKVRLVQHCQHFLEEMGHELSNGKKLNFISQEMGREINTLGAKANHIAIQKIVIDMKDELEKIKEQVLNVL